MNTINTRKLATLSILGALAYIVMLVGRIPVVLFLKYDPKDVIITIGGLIFGPFSAFILSVMVSFIEMFTVSDTGWIGFVMNLISTSAFACTAAFIYRRKHSLFAAVVGFSVAILTMTSVMLLWNYFLTPIFMNQPREKVAELILPAFLPFNLLKGTLNSAIVMLIYKPVTTALRKQSLIPQTERASGGKKVVYIGVSALSCFIIVSCILFMLVMQGKI